MVAALIAALLGAGTGLGLLVVAAGSSGRSLRATDSPASVGSRLAQVDQLLLRVAGGLGSALLVGLLTRWPVAAGVAALAGIAAPSAVSASGRHGRELARVEAVAGWVEQLRDTLSAANGLEHALAASARVAPRAIAPEVEWLAARAGYEPLPGALRRFADEVDHPLADFVVAALIVAAEKEARDLGSLLGQLAETAREEAKLRNRVWVSRARNRTVVRVIAGVVLTVVGGLFVLDREYLRPYDSAAGQLALMVIAAVFAGSLIAMERIGRIDLPDRFIGTRAAGGARP